MEQMLERSLNVPRARGVGRYFDAFGALGLGRAVSDFEGQVAMAFAVLKDPSKAGTPADALKLEGEIMKLVDEQLGAVARPARVRFVTGLPKTRSGKLLRRAIQAVCELRDPGDLTTMEDPMALQQIKDLLKPA